jgi:hypothetical protein
MPMAVQRPAAASLFGLAREYCSAPRIPCAFPHVRIPTHSGQGFRFDVGHRSDLIPATIPK